MTARNQVYDMTRDIAVNLGARKFPVPISYGPERTKRTVFNTGIVVERDRKANDGVRSAPGVARHPVKQYARDLAVVVHVYVQSTAGGARVVEHEAECDQIVDAFVGELRDWISGGKAGVDPQITESRYLAPEDLAAMSADGAEGLERWPGVVYRIKFRLPRGVTRLDYQGNAPETGTPASVGGDIEVKVNGVEPPEIVPMP